MTKTFRHDRIVLLSLRETTLEEIRLEIEFSLTAITLSGMLGTYLWGRYWSKEEIMEDVIKKTIHSLAENDFVMLSKDDDGDTVLVSVSSWLETFNERKRNESV